VVNYRLVPPKIRPAIPPIIRYTALGRYARSGETQDGFLPLHPLRQNLRPLRHVYFGIVGRGTLEGGGIGGPIAEGEDSVGGVNRSLGGGGGFSCSGVGRWEDVQWTMMPPTVAAG